MLQVDPYLTFDGNCAEAMRFYERTLGGKIEMLMTHKDSPMADQIPPGQADRVAHARLAFKGRIIMASDTMVGQPFGGMKGFSLALMYATAAEAKQVFAALSEGGQVHMPVQKTFWAEAFGMLVDRYGTPWMVNGNMSHLGADHH